MIDLHSHILPSIDDGASSMEESLELLEKAVFYGVTDLVLTPHFIVGSYDADNEKKILLLEELKQKVSERNLPISLYLGNEVFVENNLLELLETGKITTLHRSRYLLFEVPRLDLYQGIYDIIFFLQSKGIRPILAHPERYLIIQKDPNVALKLKEQGVLFQVNLGSFVGTYGKSVQDCALLLAKHRMIDFVSSDIHHIHHCHYKHIDEVKKILKKILTEDEVEHLFSLNAKKVLLDEELEEKEFIPFQKSLFGKWK